MSGRRLGVTLPFDDVSLRDHRPLLRRLVEAGYGEVWTGEVSANDGYSPLALWAGWEDELSITCAVSSVFTRGPGVLAITAASMGEIAPGRSRFGIGAGSDVIVSTWNGTPFDRPYQKVADTLRFLRQVLAGGRADDYETVHGKGFKLARPLEQPPALILAALGPRMQELAAAEADGVCLNFLGAGDVATIRSRCDAVTRTAPGELEVSARIFVIPGEGEAVDAAARRHLAGYLTVGVYAKFQEWLGRGPELVDMQQAWAAGDRKLATKLLQDSTVQDLVVYGSPEVCARHIDAYFAAGLDAATLYLLPTPEPLSPEGRVDFLTQLAAHLPGGN